MGRPGHSCEVPLGHAAVGSAHPGDVVRSKEWNQRHGYRHRTPAELIRRMLAVLLPWFPKRPFIFAGDGGFGTHELSHFAYRHRSRLTLVRRFYDDANLYAPPHSCGIGQKSS